MEFYCSGHPMEIVLIDRNRTYDGGNVFTMMYGKYHEWKWEIRYFPPDFDMGSLKTDNFIELYDKQHAIKQLFNLDEQTDWRLKNGP